MKAFIILYATDGRPFFRSLRLLFVALLLVISGGYQANAQIIEAAYCEWDDQFDEWKLAINAEEYVFAVRQFGQNPYRRWNLEYIGLDDTEIRGFMQLKREGDVNYWDLYFGEEQISITTIYRGDIFLWKVDNGEQTFSFAAADQFGTSWSDRYEKNIDWTMYQVEQGDVRDWYIDEEAGSQLTFPLRIAASMIIVEMMTFGR